MCKKKTYDLYYYHRENIHTKLLTYSIIYIWWMESRVDSPTTRSWFFIIDNKEQFPTLPPNKVRGYGNTLIVLQSDKITIHRTKYETLYLQSLVNRDKWPKRPQIKFVRVISITLRPVRGITVVPTTVGTWHVMDLL